MCPKYSILCQSVQCSNGVALLFYYVSAGAFAMSLLWPPTAMSLKTDKLLRQDSLTGLPFPVEEPRNLSPQENRICIKRVVLEEVLEYDEEIRCTHVSEKSCFKSYTTTFKSVKEIECEEKFTKVCEIRYNPVPKTVFVKICNQNFERNCNATSTNETVCTIEHETICQTEFSPGLSSDVADCEITYEEICDDNSTTENQGCNDVPKQTCYIVDENKFQVSTDCQVIPKEICGSSKCPLVVGATICNSESRNIIVSVPTDDCEIIPESSCQTVDKLKPVLEQSEKCVDIPKEICVKDKKNPVRKKRPKVKFFCGSPENGTSQSDATTIESSADIFVDSDLFLYLEPSDGFEFYSHFLLVNDDNDGTFITFDADGQNCPLTPFEPDASDETWQAGKFGMVMNGNNLIRICGAKTTSSQAILSCLDYEKESNSLQSEISYDSQARSKSGVIEIAMGRYWITGGLMWQNNVDRTTTDTSIILEYGEPVKNGPKLPKPLRSHCLVRINTTHLLLHGGIDDTNNISKKTYIFDVTRQSFDEAKPSRVPFSRHVCGVVREEEGSNRVLAVGGGRDRNIIESYDISANTWTDLGEFPDGLSVQDVTGWQMEDTFQVIGLRSSTDGENKIIYEFDSFINQFILIDQVELPESFGDKSVLIPVPATYGNDCLEMSV